MLLFIMAFCSDDTDMSGSLRGAKVLARLWIRKNAWNSYDALNLLSQNKSEVCHMSNVQTIYDISIILIASKASYNPDITG